MVTSIDTAQLVFLVESSKIGNDDAFQALYDTFSKVVEKTARYRVDSDAVLDVVQETFYRAYRYLHTLRDPEQFGSWIVRIAKNVCQDHMRLHATSSRDEPFDVEDMSDVLAEEAHVDIHERIDLERVLSKVPPQYMRCIVWHYLEDMTVPEIALTTGLPSSTVKWRIHRGLELCRLVARSQGKFER